jgi:ABC-type Zn uptake system ZnuABC Zn-binding protein ZnuA
LASLTTSMKDASVRVLIVEPSASRSIANRVASGSGARVATLIPSVGGDPEARDYLQLFELNVRRLVEALGGAR